MLFIHICYVSGLTSLYLYEEFVVLQHTLIVLCLGLKLHRFSLFDLSMCVVLFSSGIIAEDGVEKPTEWARRTWSLL